MGYTFGDVLREKGTDHVRAVGSGTMIDTLSDTPPPQYMIS